MTIKELIDELKDLEVSEDLEIYKHDYDCIGNPCDSSVDYISFDRINGKTVLILN